jgi:hypothetical protein
MSSINEIIASSKWFYDLKGNEKHIAGTLIWCGKKVEVQISIDEDEFLRNLSLAEDFWEKQEKWKVTIESLLLDKLWGNTWEEEGNKKLPSSDFLSRINLVSMMFDDGMFELWFTDGELYSGHSIVVSGNLQNGPMYADAPM